MSIMKRASLGAASLLAAAVFAGPSFADGLPTRGKVRTHDDGRACTTSGNVGLTTDYVFRGISQSNEEAAVQGGVDFTCGRFYLGVWASSIFAAEATTEVDIYGGVKGKAGPVSWDLGLIYYYYPGEPSGAPFGFGNYLELKAAGSIDVTKGGALSGTVFYSPDYAGFLGSTVTLEGSFTQTLPRLGMLSPTFGATIGRSYLDDSNLDYTYWNVGVTFSFLERWSVDVRYWGTDGDGLADTFLADDRVLATVKYTF